MSADQTMSAMLACSIAFGKAFAARIRSNRVIGRSCFFAGSRKHHPAVLSVHARPGNYQRIFPQAVPGFIDQRFYSHVSVVGIPVRLTSDGRLARDTFWPKHSTTLPMIPRELQ